MANQEESVIAETTLGGTKRGSPEHLLTSFHTILIVEYGGHLPTLSFVLTPLTP